MFHRQRIRRVSQNTRVRRASVQPLRKIRIKIEADTVVQGVHKVDASIVKSYARDLHTIL